MGWGQQLDIVEIQADEDTNDTATTRGKVAGYLAKYSTKGSDAVGALDKRLSQETDLDYLKISNHLARMVRKALSSKPYTHAEMRELREG